MIFNLKALTLTTINEIWLNFKFLRILVSLCFILNPDEIEKKAYQILGRVLNREDTIQHMYHNASQPEKNTEI
jgi:hypothetical protein